MKFIIYVMSFILIMQIANNKISGKDKDKVEYRKETINLIKDKYYNNPDYAITDKDSANSNSELENTFFASLIKFAQKDNISISGIHLAPQNSKPCFGDNVTLLVTLINGDEPQQWLSIIRQDSLTKEEKELSPLPENVIYTSTGRVLKFRNTRTALNVFFIGPFTRNGRENYDQLNYLLSKPNRILLSEEQLNLGLDNYGRTAIALTKRANQAKAKEDDLFYIGAPVPLTKDQLEKGQKYFDLIHPTEYEERVRFSVTLALDDFLSATLKINDFSNLLNEVLNRPSIWSVISNLGVSRGLLYNPAEVKLIDAKDIGINLITYEQPIRLTLNGQAALNAFIIMTEARPPLQTCAGIVKIYAEDPLDNIKKLIIQLIAANYRGR